MNAVVVILLVVGVVWYIVQTTQAHGKQLDPSTFRPSFVVERRLQPIATDPNGVVSAAAAKVSGLSVAAVVGNSVYLNCRPNVTRLDDGMGMFLRVTSTVASGDWVLRIEGAPKSRLALNTDSQRGFQSVERQLRQAIGTLGHHVDDGLGGSPSAVASTNMPVATVSSAPPPPPPARSTIARVEHGQNSWVIAGISVVGRDPSGAGSATASAVRIDDPLLSKQHVSLRTDGRVVWVQDRGSTNGTMVRSRAGDRRLAAGVDEQLFDGDVVLIGDQQLVVRITEV